jgi:hypothetical protein
MTTSKTSRLGLMSPTGSDAFVTQDFADTTAILDANPGVYVCANAAGRPTTYTSAQDGSLVYQKDLRVLLAWDQVSSGVTGTWKRINPIGFLGQMSNSGSVSTSTRTYSSGPTIVTGTITVPGGRPILVMGQWGQSRNDYGQVVLSYWENNVRIADMPFEAWTDYLVNNNFWLYRNPAPDAQLSLTVKLTLASYNASPPNGGGTSSISNTNLAIFEV